jgi:aldehyde:ferredoxin oxidoreductase
MNWREFYEGRGLVVDLASGKVRQETLKSEDAESKMGGAALNLALYQRYAESDPIILSTGPLTASFAPASCLAVMTAQSPVNGKLYHVPLTWQAGAELKFSGLDYLVLLAEANKPVMLRVRKGQAELTSAEMLWGRDISETVRAVRSANPDDGRCILAIGPAGEGKTLYAQVNQNFWGTLDKAGFGTLWGRKKLKALLMMGIGGRMKVRPDHPALSRQLAEEIKKGIPPKTAGSMAILKRLGEKAFDPALFRSRAKHFACFHCPFPCQTFMEKKSSTGLLRKKKTQEALLLTDPGGALAFRDKGKNAISFLAECFRLGLEPMAAALCLGLAKGGEEKGKPGAFLNLLQQGEDLSEKGLPNIQNLAPWPGPENEITAMAERLGFSTGIPPVSPEGKQSGQGVKEWAGRVAYSLILGVCPILTLIAPKVSEEKLIAFMGTEDKMIGVNMGRLHAAARDLLGEMANPSA